MSGNTHPISETALWRVLVFMCVSQGIAAFSSTLCLILLLNTSCVPPAPPAEPVPVVTDPPTKPAPAPVPDRPVLLPGQELPEDVKRLLERHNAERSNRGAPPLVANAQLNLAAYNHAQWMVTNNNLSHTGSGGSSVSQRVAAQGYRATAVGENIAAGYKTEELVFAAWMDSAGHRGNIYNRTYSAAGLAKVVSKGGKTYWCVVFARPAVSQVSDLDPAAPVTGYAAAEESCPEPLEADDGSR